MHIGVNELGTLVADLTRRLEGRGGSISAMEASRNQFEHWWKGELFLAFSQEPWLRRPGRRPAIEAGVDLGMESTWQVTDLRRAR